MSLLQTIHSCLLTATSRVFPQLPQEIIAKSMEVAPSTQERFGDYQCNAAMRLAKELGKPPREIAKEIAAEIEGTLSTEIAGPGFINLTLSDDWLKTQVNHIAKDERLGVPLADTKQKILVEFSSPNIAKELHVGHLRSTIIGESLARLFTFLGHEVSRISHVGDWGTSFGMLIAYLKQHHSDIFQGKEEATLSQLATWYKEAKKKFDADTSFQETSRKEVVALQGGDPESLRAWETLCTISRKAYQEIYTLLDVTLTERGESFYNPMLAEVVQDLLARGIATESEGAICVFLEGFENREGAPLPFLIQKRDGGYNYATTDLAALRHRTEVERQDRVIYVVDLGQATHFSMLYKTGEKAGYYDPAKTRMEHVGFGLVLGPDGKKFRTRSGETERLIDLLHTAIEKAGEIVEKRHPEIPKVEQLEMAHKLGLSALKYADLSCHRQGDYTFSYERMLQFEGNTATFILYSYVRTQSILEKAGKAPLEEISLSHPSERKLVLHLLRFAEAVEQMADALAPHRMTDYLFHLAETFNSFFRDCRVLGEERQGARLALCKLTGAVLKKGLSLLGIETLRKM